jgi:hypothetical protein
MRLRLGPRIGSTLSCDPAIGRGAQSCYLVACGAR